VRLFGVSKTRGQQHPISGVVLLEVILALVLFVAAAAILTATMNTSMASVERQKLSLRAENLASSVLAEIQLGARPVESASAIVFEPPFDDWSGEIAVTPTETEGGSASQLSLVEVVVRHKGTPTVQRQSQLLNLSSGKSEDTSSLDSE
jgi:type II secretory pathway pseudopilin PulG